jgi:hypothetical protein
VPALANLNLCRVYQGIMIIREPAVQASPRWAVALALCLLGPALSGCAGMSDSMSTAFADPAKYDLYDCKQLENERKALANRSAELQGLMAKAETGVGGSVVGELAYRNEIIAVHGQSRFAEEAWQKNKCHETPAPSPAAPAKPPTSAKAKSKSKSSSGGAN